MRRTIAILVLVGGGWSQLTVLDCPMVAPAELASAGTAHHEAGHGAGGHGSDGAAAAAAAEHHRSPPSPHHSGADCRLLMACGGAVLTAHKSAMIAEPAPTAADAIAPPTRASSTFDQAHEPPPPRLPV